MADRRRLPAIYDRVDDDTIEVQGQVDESSDSNVEDVPDEDGLRSKYFEPASMRESRRGFQPDPQDKDSLPNTRGPETRISRSTAARKTSSRMNTSQQDTRSNQAPGNITSTASYSDQSSAPREIVWLEGDIKELPETTKQFLETFCAVNQSRKLPWTQAISDNFQLKRTEEGWQRKWYALPHGQQIQMGRFRYGLDQQILVAQVPEGMEWECGSVAILTPSAQTDRWNIWQGQKSIEDIPANDLKVACYSLTGIIEPAREVDHEFNQYQGHTGPRLNNSSRSFSSVDYLTYRDDGSDQSPNPTEKAGGISNSLEALPQIQYLEGDITTFPRELKHLIETFHNKYPDTKMPCTGKKRPEGISLYETPKSGRRQWVTFPDEQPLRAGSFKYGDHRKIMIVQGFPGSDWEQGAARIVVHDRTANKEKIWRGQADISKIPKEDIRVKWIKAGDAVTSETDIDRSDPPVAPAQNLRTRFISAPDTGTSQKTIGNADDYQSSAAREHLGKSNVSQGSSSSATKNDRSLPKRSYRRAETALGKRRRSTNDSSVVTRSHRSKKGKFTSVTGEATWEDSASNEDTQLDHFAGETTSRQSAQVYAQPQDEPSSKWSHALSLSQAGSLAPSEQASADVPASRPPAETQQGLNHATARSLSRGRLSAIPQLPNPQEIPDVHARTFMDDSPAGFDINATRIFLPDSLEKPRLRESTFSTTSDIRRLFARARVTKIATQDTLLLEASIMVEGNEHRILLQRDVQEDFEALEDAIMEQEATEVTIREEPV